MTILLLGATGRTGRQVIRAALAKGHRIVAVTRRANQLPPDPAVKVVVGDPRQESCIADSLNGADIVLSCLGQRSSEDATLLTDSAAAVAKTLTNQPSTPFLVVSQGLLFPSRNPLIGVLRFFLRRHVRDSEGMEHAVRTSALAWEIIRPPRLKDSSRPRGYRIEVDKRPQGPWEMERADLAQYLVDEAETRSHLRQIVGITSRA